MDPNRVPLGTRPPASLPPLTLPSQSAAAAAGVPPGFVAAPSFAGARPGCTFKTGEHGTGYYPDLERSSGGGEAATTAAAHDVGAIAPNASGTS